MDTAARPAGVRVTRRPALQLMRSRTAAEATRTALIAAAAPRTSCTPGNICTCPAAVAYVSTLRDWSLGLKITFAFAQCYTCVKVNQTGKEKTAYDSIFMLSI